MSIAHWKQVETAARRVLAATQAAAVREEDVAAVRVDVHHPITNDLGVNDRQLAGDLAASFLSPNQRISAALTEQARQAARDNVSRGQVQVRQNEVSVRAGDLITQLDLEKLDQLGLTRPRLEIATVIGDALVAILLSLLLVAFLWRFQPQIWHRNRSLLLFGLTLLVSAVAIRIAGNRSIWTYAIPTSAAVMLIGILLEGYAGAAMAAALAVIAGVINPSGFGPAVYVLSGGMASLLAIG